MRAKAIGPDSWHQEWYRRTEGSRDPIPALAGNNIGLKDCSCLKVGFVGNVEMGLFHARGWTIIGLSRSGVVTGLRSFHSLGARLGLQAKA